MEFQTQVTEYINTRHTSPQPGPWSMIRSPKIDTKAFISNNNTDLNSKLLNTDQQSVRS